MSQAPTISTRRGTMQQQGLTTPVTPSVHESNDHFRGEADGNRNTSKNKGEGTVGDQFGNNLTKLLQSRTNALSPTTSRVESSEYSHEQSPERSKDHSTTADNKDLEKQRSESSSSLMNVLQAAQILAAASAAPGLRANRNQVTTKKPGQLGAGTPPLQSIVNEEITDYYQLLRNGQITASIVRQVFQTVTVPLDLDPTSPFAVSQHNPGANFSQPSNVIVRFQNLSQRYGENFETLYAELQNRRSTLGIGKPIWDKLARREYVDLAQFHPDRLLLGFGQPSAFTDSVDATPSAAPQSVFPKTAGISAGPTQSSTSQIPRELRSYPGWARAWNRYTQARTTLFADDLAQLRKYQELIVGWAEQFQWAAVLKFDVARRGYHASDPRDLLTTDVPAIRMSYLGTPDVRLRVDVAEENLGTASQGQPPLTAAIQQQVIAQQGYPQSQPFSAFAQQSAGGPAGQGAVQNQFDASGQQRSFNQQQQFQQPAGGFQNGIQQAVPQVQPNIAGRPVNNFSNFGKQSNLPPLPPNLNPALVPPVPAHVQQALSQQHQFGAVNPSAPRSGGPLRITTSNGQTKDIQVCGEFNARRGCTRKHCVYLHQCTGCGNPDHGRVNCPRNGPRSAPHSLNPYPIPMIRPIVNPNGPANNMMNSQMFPQQMQNQQSQLPMQQQQGFVGQQQQPGQMMQPQQGFNNTNQGMQQNFGVQNGQQQLQNGIQQQPAQQQQFFQGMQPQQQQQQMSQGGFQQQQPVAQSNQTQAFYQGYQGSQQQLPQQAIQQQQQQQGQQQMQQLAPQSQQKQLSPQPQAGYAPQQQYGSVAPNSVYSNTGFVGTMSQEGVSYPATSVAQQGQSFQTLDAQGKLSSQSQQPANQQQQGQGEPSPRLANQGAAGGGAVLQSASSQGNESVWRLLQHQ
ncbi:hypothetical protein BJ742DRAFT_778186 [Cladochytrium replicatum]|nr:hypothetical protein BJ742DRAFT_778186 [Cladochytrium replicatum]